MSHQCHAHGCTKEVPPKLLMCSRHWFALPKQVQRAIWREYRVGQERDKSPSLRYLAVQRFAVAHSAMQAGQSAEAAGYFDQAASYRQQAIAGGFGDPLLGLWEQAAS